MKNKIKVGMFALGCEKNRIDAEVMLASLKNAGCEICNDENECDILIVHTCTFIDKAKEESIENILNAAAKKTDGNCKKLIVTGCLAERYRSEILKEIPEVDAVLGSKSFNKILDIIDFTNCDHFEHYEPLTSETPTGNRLVTTPPYSIYIKIADGCSNHCSYCVIPQVRGEFMPRSYESILSEVIELSNNCQNIEVNLIAQDTTAHPDLCKLIKDIAKIPSVYWIRILYCRPEEISDELINLMAEEEKLVKYIDVPLQHASGKILKLMNRTMDDEKLLNLIKNLREKIPNVSLRTTFITGFPHESEKDFEILCNFVKNARFNNLGVFTYSKEEGTKAGRMKNQVSQSVKEQRADVIMNLQMNLLAEINKEFLDKTYTILCEGFDCERNLYIGRAYFQAPDIDGKVYFSTKSNKNVEEGQFYPVYLEKFDIYDFYGTLND